MFSHDGPARSARKNWILASYLAVVAGCVNAAGLEVAGVFTSHVTGNVGRVAQELAKGEANPARLAAILVLSFLVGAFAATTILESSLFSTKRAAYGTALLSEAAVLIAFVLVSSHLDIGPRAGLLCFAMGLQNSLVTLVSQARVRTTHLTGIVTDLGIELARWLRWSRVFSRADAPRIDRPSAGNVWLLVTLVASFFVGAVLGARSVMSHRSLSILFPAVALLAASLFIFRTGSRRA